MGELFVYTLFLMLNPRFWVITIGSYLLVCGSPVIGAILLLIGIFS